MITTRQKSLPPPLPAWVGQAARFGAVGLLNTLVDFSVYFLLSRWFGALPSTRFLLKGASYAAGVANSFFWNKTWTFKSQTLASRAFLPFLAASLFALGLNAGIMHLTSVQLAMPEPIALALATAATLLWNFTTSKFLIFPPMRPSQPPASPARPRIG